jgi:hypothetical protein
MCAAQAPSPLTLGDSSFLPLTKMIQWHLIELPWRGSLYDLGIEQRPQERNRSVRAPGVGGVCKVRRRSTHAVDGDYGPS